jgi:hypothetical protein
MDLMIKLWTTVRNVLISKSPTIPRFRIEKHHLVLSILPPTVTTTTTTLITTFLTSSFCLPLSEPICLPSLCPCLFDLAGCQPEKLPYLPFWLPAPCLSPAVALWKTISVVVLCVANALLCRSHNVDIVGQLKLCFWAWPPLRLKTLFAHTSRRLRSAVWQYTYFISLLLWLY